MIFFLELSLKDFNLQNNITNVALDNDNIKRVNLLNKESTEPCLLAIKIRNL